MNPTYVWPYYQKAHGLVGVEAKIKLYVIFFKIIERRLEQLLSYRTTDFKTFLSKQNICIYCNYTLYLNTFPHALLKTFVKIRTTDDTACWVKISKKRAE